MERRWEFPPAQLGSVWRAVERGHRRISLIDGVFGAHPAVWRKEILYALSRGCTVIGGASMGALRAAELWPMGMLGRGAICRLYRRGALIDDAEVARALPSVHFTKRNWGAIAMALRQADLPDNLADTLRANRVRRKEMDARLVIDALHDSGVSSPRPNWSFPVTTFWLHQFEDNRDDIPTLPAPVGG